jgi:hypothetical protein
MIAAQVVRRTKASPGAISQAEMARNRAHCESGKSVSMLAVPSVASPLDRSEEFA